jgi:hypothetical protein
MGEAVSARAHGKKGREEVQEEVPEGEEGEVQ